MRSCGLRQGSVALVKRRISLIGNRIKRFTVRLIGLRIFTRHNRVFTVLCRKMLVLDDSRVGPPNVTVVYHRRTLKIPRPFFHFKSQRAVFQGSKAIVEELVDPARVDYPSSCELKLLLVSKKVHFGFYTDQPVVEKILE